MQRLPWAPGRTLDGRLGLRKRSQGAPGDPSGGRLGRQEGQHRTKLGPQEGRHRHLVFGCACAAQLGGQNGTILGPTWGQLEANLGPTRDQLAVSEISKDTALSIIRVAMYHCSGTHNVMCIHVLLYSSCVLRPTCIDAQVRLPNCLRRRLRLRLRLHIRLRHLLIRLLIIMQIICA